ncbi:hypothetical protein OS493_008921 [Desmophyllum pertusum]|uniref:Uncharacterized protein n=1 Tax=Desmophyllum pertusum TaxID=174260 RepID=A0A9X0CYQ3_9CNID|nr:hypothetical protein OS493_008921 [Desmophyllum pertusum]
MTILTERCEDYLLRKMEKMTEIGPVLETLIVAQTYSLERVKTECVNKTQKLGIEEVKSHELYEQVEPLCQRKMIELQMSNMEKKLRDAKAELLDSKAEISRLQGKIGVKEGLASNGLRYFESVVCILGSHIRNATNINTSAFRGFNLTTEQNLATICNDTYDGIKRPCSKTARKEKRHTLLQVLEHGEQDTSAKTDIQVHITEDNQSFHQNLEDGNGQEKRVCETQTQEQQSSVIQQPSPDKICTEDAYSSKNKRPDLKRNPGRKAEVSPTREIQFDEQALTEGRAAWVESGKETCGLKCIPQRNIPKEHPPRKHPKLKSSRAFRKMTVCSQRKTIHETPEDLWARPKGDLPSCLKKAKLPEM